MRPEQRRGTASLNAVAFIPPFIGRWARAFAEACLLPPM
jgi:hypothetical protein